MFAPPAPPVIPAQVLQALMAEARLNALHSGQPALRMAFEPGVPLFGLAAAEAGMSQALGENHALRSPGAGGAAAAELAREIAQQIGARITPLGRGQFELALAPAELGRLEIALREVDGVMTLSVNADRPETLDLIRRHVDVLMQELRQMTQRDLAMQWGMGGHGAGSGNPGQPARSVRVEAEPAAVASPVRTGLGTDHLDLRL